MALVFISHAATDKRRLKPLCQALSDYGHKLFIDRPLEAGFSAAQIRRLNIQAINLAEEWDIAIARWLRASDAVLGCFSAALEDASEVWRSELEYAMAEEKLVACLIDETPFETLPGDLNHIDIARLQMRRIDLKALAAARDKAAADQSEAEENAVENARSIGIAIKKRAAAVQFRASTRKAQRRAIFDPSRLAFVDRKPQKISFNKAIKSMGAHSSVQVLMLSGPENECADRFLERITDFSERDIAASPHVIQPQWPMDLPPQAFEEEFADCLAEALRLEPPVDEIEIAEALARLPQPILCICAVRLVEWSAADLERLRLFGVYWRKIVAEYPGLTVVATLSAIMEPAQPGWQEHGVPPDDLTLFERLRVQLGFATRVTNRRFLQESRLVAEADEAELDPEGEHLEATFRGEMVELLAPLARRHVDQWLAEYVPGAGPSTKAAFARLFEPPEAKRWGVSMEQFLEHAEIVFSDRGEGERE